MFSYNSSETIINGAYLTDGVTPQWSVVAQAANPSSVQAGEDVFVNYFGGEKALVVTRVVKFVDKFITQIFRTPAVAAVKETVVLTVPSGGLEANKTYRLVMDVILDQGSQSAEYSRWAIHKGKPYEIEFRTPTAISNTTDAATFMVTKIKKGLANPDFPQIAFTVTSSGAAITIVTKDAAVKFKSVNVELLNDTGGITSYFIVFDATTATPAAGKAVVSVPGTLGFANYDWMIKNLRLPTVENLRFAGTMQDEYPIPGASYVQFTIDYEKPRDLVGNNALSAPATSKTNHTFYVISTAAAAFYTDLQTVLGGEGVMEPFVSNVPDALSSGDKILETTDDNPPV